MEEKYFVKTSDEYTASILRKEGFQELAKEGNMYVFLNRNDVKINFKQDNMKVNLDNKLCF